MRCATLVAFLVAVLATLPMLACSESESVPDDRTSVPSETTSDAGGDAALTEAGVDPSGGRDSLPASCFAACQNIRFTCQAKNGSSTTVSEVELQQEGSGCAGTIKASGDASSVALKLDCSLVTVCVGGPPGSNPSSCVPGTFSAFTFGYTPAGGSLTVCTRQTN